MRVEEIKTIVVLGAGQMGQGIVTELILQNFQIVLVDKSEELAAKGRDMALANILALDAKGKRRANLISEVLKERFADVCLATLDNLTALAKADFVIEAATENEQLKLALFHAMDKICPPQVILASNTSTIPIGRLAAATNRPEKVIGMHFMNPVPLMQLVEIIKTPVTSEETYEVTMALAKKLGKTCVTARDRAGFIVNRVLFGLIPQAFKLWEEGTAAPEDIDLAMKLGCNHPMGPLALTDLIGLDTCLSILDVLRECYGEIYTPPENLKKLVAEGKLGRKSGKGVYSY